MINKTTQMFIVMAAGACAITVAAVYTFIYPMNNFENGAWHHVENAKNQIMWILFIVHAAGPCFILLCAASVNANPILMTQSQLHHVLGAVLAYHALLWVRMSTPAYVAAWLWTLALGYCAVRAVNSDDKRVLAPFVAPLTLAAFYQSVLWALSRYAYFIRLEKVAGAEPYHEMFSIIPFIVSCVFWVYFSDDASIDYNIARLRQHMINVEHFAAPDMQYTSIMAVQSFAPTSMYPLVRALEVLTETQGSIQEEVERCRHVKEFFDSDEVESKELITTEVSQLLSRVEQVTPQSEYNKRLDRVRVTLMTDPQYSAQLQAYQMEKHTRALEKNTSATNANTSAQWFNTLR